MRSRTSDWDIGKETEPKALPEWLYRDGKAVRQKLKCWSEPHGCQRFFFPNEIDLETRLCKQCNLGIQARFGITPGMVAIVLGFIDLDDKTVKRMVAACLPKEKLQELNLEQPLRVKWFLNVIGNKAPTKEDMAKFEKLSETYFTKSFERFGLTLPKGSRILEKEKV